MKLLHRSIAAALLAPMLVLAVSAAGFVGLRCRLTGMVTLLTCCPAVDGASDGAGAAESAVSAPGCCERIEIANAKAPAAAASAPSESESALLTASASLPVIPILRSVFRVASAVFDVDPPDPFRPPLRLLNRSLLI